jgi:hypothetical protein
MEHITITASEGKVWRRKSDGLMAGREVTLGYTYYIGGEKLEEPLWELPEHYEEVDEPVEEERTEEEPLEEFAEEEIAEVVEAGDAVESEETDG